jgi:hypothetical protein
VSETTDETKAVATRIWYLALHCRDLTTIPTTNPQLMRADQFLRRKMVIYITDSLAIQANTYPLRRRKHGPTLNHGDRRSGTSLGAELKRAKLTAIPIYL